MAEKTLQDVVDAINDLARITIALQGKFSSQADSIRQLHELSIPPARIAAILAIPQNTVHARITEAKQRAKGGSGKHNRPATPERDDGEGA